MIKQRIKRKYYILINVLLIFFLTAFLLHTYTKKTSAKINLLAEQYFSKEINKDLNDLGKVLNDEKLLNDILDIYKNDAGEILYVDYNLPNSYKLLDKITKNIISTLDKEAYPNNGLILTLPFFVGSNNVFLTNLGPKITIKIAYINSILTNIYTKITNYGLNNALVEAYVKISIDGQIISPVSNKKIATEYDLLISSKIINGRVPEFYGNCLHKSSTILDIPIKS